MNDLQRFLQRSAAARRRLGAAEVRAEKRRLAQERKAARWWADHDRAAEERAMPKCGPDVHRDAPPLTQT